MPFPKSTLKPPLLAQVDNAQDAMKGPKNTQEVSSDSAVLLGFKHAKENVP